MMKIAFVSTVSGFPWGGSEELWSRVARLLAKEGNQVGACVLVNFFVWRKGGRLNSRLSFSEAIWMFVFISTMALVPWGGSETLWHGAAKRLLTRGVAVQTQTALWSCVP